MIVIFLTALLCVVADQVTKYLVASNFEVGESVGLWDGVFHFTYVKNEGAAFGSLADARWIFMTVSVVLIVAIVGYAIWKRPKNLLLCITLGLILGGGIGNMIDRVALGYVVDFLDFCAFPELWKWVFNLADVFVCIGAGLMVIYTLKYDERTPDKASADVTDSAKGGNDNDEAE